MTDDRLAGRVALLTHPRRRYVLYCLDRYSTPIKLADVAEQVLVWERGDRPDDYLRERLHAYNDLYHEHLPALWEGGLVTYDQSDDMVSPGPDLGRVERELARYLSAEIDDILDAEREAFGDVPTGYRRIDLYRALAVPERRRALYYLLDRPGTPLDELVDVLAGWRSVRATPHTGARSQTLEVLRNVHLPTLEDVGLVEYDADAGTATLSSLADPVREVIRSAVRLDVDHPIDAMGPDVRDAPDAPDGTSTSE